MQFYLDTETEDNIARGMPPEEARRAARRKLGNATLVREEIWRMNGLGFLETVWQDLRYALRTMRRSPAFTVTAVLTLAVGIGGNTAMFTVIDGVLLKPLDYRDPGRLVRLSLSNPQQGDNNGSFPLSRLKEMRASAKSFSGIGAYLKFKENVSLSGRGEPEALSGARVSANFLDVLGVRPLVGRSFLPQEDMSGSPAVAMISAKLWTQRFGSDPQVPGKTVTLNSTPYTIVGVLPEGFAFPFADTDVWLTRPEVWSVLPSRFWGIAISNGFARLKPHVSPERAQTELDLLNRQYVLAHPEDTRTGMTIRMTSLQDQIVANVRPTLWLLFGAVSFVLLIACANVAGLLVARANSRSREFAVRAAVGAGWGRLVRQLLAESIMLALGGGAFGMLLAEWVLSALRYVSVLNLPGVGEIRLDARALGFTMILSITTGILFGLFPSLRASRPDLAAELRESGAGAGRGASGRPKFFGVNTRGLLIAGQIALSIVLLIGATLLMKSFAHLRSVDPGFQSANLLTMKISLPLRRYDTDQKRNTFFREFVSRVDAVPGARNAAVVMSLPTVSDWLGTNVLVQGQPMLDGAHQPRSRVQSVTPGYFRTMEIPLRQGREFTARDNSPDAQPVVIINESFARRFWPAYPRGQSPIGQHLREGIDHTAWMEIVGIVADVHEGDLSANSGPETYVTNVVHSPQTAYLVVRAAGDPMSYAGVIRKQVLAVDRSQPVSEVRTMEQVLNATLGQRRLTMWLLGAFAGVALLLAVIGIYGVIAYSVEQRTQEVGIRMALGAQRADILRLVVGQGLVLTAAGVGLGLFGAFTLTRVMKGLLFGVSATDPATFVGVALLFVAVALVASYLPARRAARIDPMMALRME